MSARQVNRRSKRAGTALSWLTVPCIVGYLASLWRPLLMPNTVSPRKSPQTSRAPSWGWQLPHSKAISLETQQNWLHPMRVACWHARHWQRLGSDNAVACLCRFIYSMLICVYGHTGWGLRIHVWIHVWAKPDMVPASVEPPSRVITQATGGSLSCRWIGAFHHYRLESAGRSYRPWAGLWPSRWTAQEMPLKAHFHSTLTCQPISDDIKTHLPALKMRTKRKGFYTGWQN